VLTKAEPTQALSMMSLSSLSSEQLETSSESTIKVKPRIDESGATLLFFQ